jgi:outer membrane murein-binding lipoprotein Lpp
MKKLLILLILLIAGCASKQDVRILQMQIDIKNLRENVDTLNDLNSLNFQFDALQQKMIEELQKRLARKQV